MRFTKLIIEYAIISRMKYIQFERIAILYLN